MWHRKLNSGLCDNLEGWDGVEEWGDICIPVAEKMLNMYGRNQQNIVKQLSSNKNFKKRISENN